MLILFSNSTASRNILMGILRIPFLCLFYLAASYPPRFTTDLAVFLMGNPKDFLSIMTYSPRKQYFVSAPSISAFVSLTSVLAWEQRQRLVVAGYHSTGSKSEWISYKW